MRPLFSICHPTARPDGWRKSYDLWLSRAKHPEIVEYVLCIDERWGDWESAEGFVVDRVLLNTVTANEGRKCWVDAANTAAAVSSGSIIILNGDDLEPPQDWDETLAYHIGEKYPGRSDLAIHVSTGWHDAPMASSIQIMTRARYERLGYALWPEYESLYADDDFLEHAYLDGVVIDLRDLMFPHNHSPASDWDAVYHHQNSEESRRLGLEVITRRRANQFADVRVAA